MEYSGSVSNPGQYNQYKFTCIKNDFVLFDILIRTNTLSSCGAVQKHCLGNTVCENLIRVVRVRFFHVNIFLALLSPS